jgi:signal transduction histidine kinase
LGTAIAEPRRILLLNSYGSNFSPFDDYTAMLRTELARRSPQPVDVYDASLASARFAEDQREGPFVDYLLALFSGKQLDLVVTIGAPAARFAQRYRDRLFPSVPFLITAVEQRRLQDGVFSENDAVVSVAIDLPRVIDNILRVLPGTSNVAVVIGSSPNEKFWLQQLQQEVRDFSNRVRFIWLNDLSLAEVQGHVAALPPRSAILFAQLNVDATGVPYERGQALTSIHGVANAPIFSYASAYLGRGIVGGPLIDVEDEARLAADAAVRILRGEAPGGIRPPAVGFGTPTFDWRELQRWSISEAMLPPGSILQFRQPTLWEEHHWQLLLAFAVMVLQASLITGLLFERHRRRTAQAESHRRLVELAHANRAAAASAMSTSIAHELNQPLAAILNNAETAELVLSRKPADLDLLREIVTDIRDADQRASAILLGLRALLKRENAKRQYVDLNGVVRNALRLLDAEAKVRDVEMTFDCAPNPMFVCADPVHLEQVLVNLGINAVQAISISGSRERRITFKTATTAKSIVEVSVADTGAGIHKDELKSVFESFFTTKSEGTGLGLSVVRTIVETYGGKVWADNKIGGGAIFCFTLPLVDLPAEAVL